MSKDYCVVLTTFESEEQSKEVVDEIITRKLAACVQRIPIKSKYFWEEAVQDDEELLVLIKTRSELFSELKRLLLQIHPYDTPEIVKVDISEGSEGYLNWISEVTKNE